MRSFSASMVGRSGSGYRSSVLPVSSLNALLKMRMISDDSLLTMRFSFLSHSTGTVTRPV
ncbi:hypothetical protein D3C77_817780 [compost metagenome]